jgi:hypothetical protein
MIDRFLLRMVVSVLAIVAIAAVVFFYVRRF